MAAVAGRSVGACRFD